jgi:pimeloyl-ACP methyl ester carboxylesterase
MKKVDFERAGFRGLLERMKATLQMMIPPLPWHGVRHRPGPGDRVVLLHGLWRSVWAMEAPARHLNKAGFETLIIPYPSFRKSLPEIVREVAQDLPPSPKTTHFVTHSMGGIVLRCLAAEHPELVTGRIVMLAPPNNGSEIVDWLEDSFLGRCFLGPGGMSLSTTGVPKKIPHFPREQRVDVIMGNRQNVPLFSFLLDGENDGIVTVEGGWLPGLRSFEVLEADHTFMMANPKVLDCLGASLRSE